MGFFKKKEKEEPVKELRAIVSGQVIPVSEVADPVFSSKALGEGFKVLVKQGKKVKQGDALLEFDKALVERKGLATDCILIVTNSDDLPGMKLVSGIDAVQNETVVCTF